MDRTQVNKLIFDGRLYRASKTLYSELVYLTIPGLLDELDSIMLTYKSMVRYIAEGVKDEKQAEVLSYLKQRMLALSDKIYREERKQQSSDLYYTTIRVNEGRLPSYEIFTLDAIEGGPSSLPTEERERYDRLLTILFDRVWVSEKLSAEMVKKITTSSEYLRKAIAPAITMGLVYYWDFEKLRFVLAELARNDASFGYRIRLVFALMVVLYVHPKRCNLYVNDITPMLEEANNTQPLSPYVLSLIEAYLVATDTERVVETIEETLPQIMKTKNLNSRLNNMMQDVDNFDELMKDPEMQNLEAKMMELNKLEMEGADTLFIAFRGFKNEPFFQHISSWFLPFDKYHSATRSLVEEDKIASKLLPIFELRFCDSDLYSFVLSLNQTFKPINLSDPNLEHVIEQQEELKENYELLSEQVKLKTEANNYMRNIYRFVKLYPHQVEFKEVFDKLPKSNMLLLSPYVNLEDVNTHATTFLIAKERYSDALPLLQAMVKNNPANAIALQQLATILAKQGDYENAVKYYEQSDLVVDLDDEQRLEQAKAYRNTQQYDKAIDIYKKYTNRQSVLLTLAVTYVLANQFEQALPLLHEYIYRSNKPERAYRTLAWCYFMLNQYERSEEYYGKLPHMAGSDYLNRAYLFMVMGDKKRAFSDCLAFVNSKPLPNAISEIQDDLPMLEEKGINIAELYTLLDAAQMRHEQE